MWSPQTSKFGDGISRKASELYFFIQNKKVKHFETNKQTHPAPGFCPHITNHCKILKSIQIIKKCSRTRVFRQCPYHLRIFKNLRQCFTFVLVLLLHQSKALMYNIIKKTQFTWTKTQKRKTDIKLLEINIKSLKTRENLKKTKKNHWNTWKRKKT